MSPQSKFMANPTTKIAWMTLLALSVLMALNHLVLIFVIPGESTLFIGWAAYNAYTSVVLFIPFRRGERWAWNLTGLLAISFASLIFFDAQVGLWYATIGGIMAICLWLTRGAFVSKM